MIWLLLITGIIAFLIALINGANSAGNVVGLVSNIRHLSTKATYAICSFTILLGALLMGKYVSRTFTFELVNLLYTKDENLPLILAFAALFTTLAWTSISLLLKMPISVSQMAVSGIIGSGIAVCGINCINWSRVLSVLVAWFITPFMSAAFTATAYKVNEFLKSRSVSIAYYVQNSGLLFIIILVLSYLQLAQVARTTEALVGSSTVSILVTIIITRYLHGDARGKNKFKLNKYEPALIAVSLALSFSYGAHDVANVAGLYSIAFYAMNSYDLMLDHFDASTVPMLIGALGLSLGAFIWGYRIAETIGGRIVVLTPETGLFVQFGTSITVFSLIGLGIPSSVTLAIIGSLAGIGFAKGLNYVNTGVLLKIGLMWLAGFIFVLLASMLLVHGVTKLIG